MRMLLLLLLWLLASASASSYSEEETARRLQQKGAAQSPEKTNELLLSAPPTNQINLNQRAKDKLNKNSSSLDVGPKPALLTRQVGRSQEKRKKTGFNNNGEASFSSKILLPEMLPSPASYQQQYTAANTPGYNNNDYNYNYNYDYGQNKDETTEKTNPKPIVDIVDDYEDEEEEEKSKDKDSFVDTQVVPLSKQANWQWCLLTLDGNATILRLRRDDFIRYFRMNVASLIGSDYDSVLFNSVSYTPTILVNVTLNWHTRSQRINNRLGELAERNDTLLDLSGSHFNVTHFLPWSAIMAPKPVAPMDQRMNPREMEAFIFMAVGATIAFLLTASMVFAVCQCVAKPRAATQNGNGNGNGIEDKQLVQRDESNGTLFTSQYSLEEYSNAGSRPRSRQGHPHRHPKLIYSQSFSENLMQEHQINGNGNGNGNSNGNLKHEPMHRYTPARDDSMAPLAAYEEEDPGSAVPAVSHNNKFVRYSDSQSDICSPRTETASLLDNRELLRRPCSVMSSRSHTMGHNGHRHQHRNGGGQRRYSQQAPPPAVRNGRYVRPVFQTVTIEKGPHALVEDEDDADGGFGRMTQSVSMNGDVPMMSSFKPVRQPPQPMTAEEIQRDVQAVLHNLGLDNPNYD